MSRFRGLGVLSPVWRTRQTGYAADGRRSLYTLASASDEKPTVITTTVVTHTVADNFASCEYRLFGRYSVAPPFGFRSEVSSCDPYRWSTRATLV